MDTTKLIAKDLHHSIMHHKHTFHEHKKVNFADDIHLPLVYILPNNETDENVDIVDCKKYLTSNFEEMNELDALRRFHSN
jgi:hypothetical protein